MSNAEAFDSVRRESVWQRAGPPEGALLRTSAYRAPGLPGTGRTQAHLGGPRPGGANETAGDSALGLALGPPGHGPSRG